MNSVRQSSAADSHQPSQISEENRMKNYYQKEIETASREEILKIQNEKIVKQVKYVYDNVPYYRNLMDKKGVKPEDIQSVDDIKKLPFLTKDDLREAYPYGLLGTDLKKCVRIWPHKMDGEGHFLALLRKKESEILLNTDFKELKLTNEKMRNAFINDALHTQKFELTQLKHELKQEEDVLVLINDLLNLRLKEIGE